MQHPWEKILPENPTERQKVQAALTMLSSTPGKDVRQAFHHGWAGEKNLRKARPFVDKAMPLLQSLQNQASQVHGSDTQVGKVLDYTQEIARLRRVCTQTRKLRAQSKKCARDARKLAKEQEQAEKIRQETESIAEKYRKEREKLAALQRQYEKDAEKLEADQRQLQTQLDKQTVWLLEDFANIRLSPNGDLDSTGTMAELLHLDEGQQAAFVQGADLWNRHSLTAAASENNLHMSGGFTRDDSFSPIVQRRVRASQIQRFDPQEPKTKQEIEMWQKQCDAIRQSHGKEPRKFATDKQQQQESTDELVSVWEQLHGLLYRYTEDPSIEIPDVLVEIDGGVLSDHHCLRASLGSRHTDAGEYYQHLQESSWWSRFVDFMDLQAKLEFWKRDHKAAVRFLEQHNELVELFNEYGDDDDDDDDGHTNAENNDAMPPQNKPVIPNNNNNNNDGDGDVEADIDATLFSGGYLTDDVEESDEPDSEIDCLSFYTTALRREIVGMVQDMDDPQERLDSIRELQQLYTQPPPGIPADRCRIVADFLQEILHKESNPGGVFDLGTASQDPQEEEQELASGCVRAPIRRSVGRPSITCASVNPELQAALKEAVEKHGLSPLDRDAMVRLFHLHRSRLFDTVQDTTSTDTVSSTRRQADIGYYLPDAGQRCAWGAKRLGFLKTYLTTAQNARYISDDNNTRIMVEAHRDGFSAPAVRLKRYKGFQKAANVLSKLEGVNGQSVVITPTSASKLWANYIHVDSWVPDFPFCTRQDALALDSKQRRQKYNLSDPWNYAMGGWFCIRCVQWLDEKDGDCQCRCFRGHTRTECAAQGSGCYGFHPNRYMEYLALGLPYNRARYDDQGTGPGVSRRASSSRTPNESRYWSSGERWKMFRFCVKTMITGQDPWFGVVPTQDGNDSEHDGHDGLVEDFAPLIRDWFENLQLRRDPRGSSGRCKALAKAHLDLMLDATKYQSDLVPANHEPGSVPNWQWISERCPMCGMTLSENRSQCCRGYCSGCRCWNGINAPEGELIRDVSSPYHVFARSYASKRAWRQRKRSKKPTSTSTTKPATTVAPKPDKRQKKRRRRHRKDKHKKRKHKKIKKKNRKPSRKKLKTDDTPPAPPPSSAQHTDPSVYTLDGSPFGFLLDPAFYTNKL